MNDEKRRALELAERHVCPDRVRTFGAIGIDLVIGRREGYRLWDLDGRELLDLHLNGGVFNLGHRHPELVAALRDALDTLDVGNHHFPSVARAELAEALVRTMPGDLRLVVFAPSGGEAIDVAIKSARHATQRRTIVSIRKGYHGHTGLALAAGDDRFSRLFLSEGPPGDFVQVPFNDLDAMEEALRRHQVAAVVLETIPATYGFPLPAPGYLPGREGALRALRRALRRGRGADGARAHGAALGRRVLRRRAGHPRDRQGALGRSLPDLGGRAHAARRPLARGGRLGARLHLRRRGARLSRRAEGPRDHDAAPACSRTWRPSPTASPPGSRRSARAIPDGSSRSAGRAW